MTMARGEEKGFKFSMLVLLFPVGAGIEFPGETKVAHSFSSLLTIWPVVLGNNRLTQSSVLGRHSFPCAYGQTRNAYSGDGEFPCLQPAATKHQYSLCYSSVSTSQIIKKQKLHLVCSAVNTDSCGFLS